MTTTIAIVPGEGIGPEIIRASCLVLEATLTAIAHNFTIVDAPAMDVRDEFGMCLDDTSRSFYDECFAAGVPILHGPAGGRFVYQLRNEYELAVKLTPIRPMVEIADASPLRPERLDGADILIVRDNAAGLYQGNFGWRDGNSVAFHEATYSEGEVRAVLINAMAQARRRDNKVTVVTKPGGVPSISALWKRVTLDEATTDVELNFLEIDNACYQLVTNPRAFDVMVAPNMFGDVLGDTGSILLGSRGMSYSANFSTTGRAVYQTAHGAANDLAGLDVANPIAQILTMAWMLHSSCEIEGAEDLIRDAVRRVVAEGWRTSDIASAESRVIGTREMGERIAAAVSESS